MKYFIESIEIVKDVVNIKLIDDNSKVFIYKIHAVAYANYYVSNNTFINDELLSNLLKESSYYFIKDNIIKKLKLRDYSKYEIKEIIYSKLDEEDSDRLINDLERNNYLNDYNYVKRVFDEANNKLKGRLFIESKLINKKIDESIISSFYSLFNDRLLAKKLINKEYKKLENKYPINTIINKIIYKLNYHGFNEDIINEEIESIKELKSNPDEKILLKDYLKVLKRHQNKYKNQELERKVIETLLLKGYNYKSVKALIEGMKQND